MAPIGGGSIPSTAPGREEIRTRGLGEREQLRILVGNGQGVLELR